MLISILMITYNHEKYIEQAIESVLMQKGNFDIELLIGNDKSPDNTEKILEKYRIDSRIKIFNRKENLGATNNLVDLFLKANGEYIAILEGDDYWTDNLKLNEQLAILEKHKEYILCYTDSDIIDENNKIIGKKYVRNKEIVNFKSLIANSGEIPTGTTIFRNIFKKNNNFENIKEVLLSGKMIGDLSLFSILIKEGKFIRLDKVTGAYRFITNSKISTSYSAKKDIFKKLELYKVTKAIKKYYKNDIYTTLLAKRREYELIREIKKENKTLKEFGLKKNKNLIIYQLIKPFHDLSLSIYKKIYK